VLASSGQQRHVDAFLDKLDARGLADGWTSSADVKASKPAPDLLQVALKKLARFQNSATSLDLGF
jgi:beta-phosphoglucomutase-like phosphatase (HAD superfamily)